MSKPPAFQFYASDFLTDYNVAVMSLKARGVYITLLAHAWLETGLPNDEKKLARICGDPNDWDEIWEEVRICFEAVGGRLYNGRMETERHQLKSYIESRKVAGRKGAQVRWQNDARAMREPMLEDSSSSSTSTTTSESKKLGLPKHQIEEFWEDHFEEFWEVVLNKKDKKRALKAYMVARSKGVTNPTLISTYKEQAVANRSEWTKDRGKYCPHPSTWLNGERWLDEISEESDEHKNGEAPIVKKTSMICPLCDKNEKHERGTWQFCEKGHNRIKMIPEGEMSLQHIQDYVTAIREEEGIV